jgi:hypothetical protein
MAKRTPAPPPEPATRQLNIPCPIDLHRKLALRAVMDDMSQKDVVLTALEEYLG